MDLRDAVLLSHALVGWIGGPVGLDGGDRRAVVQALADEAEKEQAICLFAGVDARDADALGALYAEGFAVARFHTHMVRGLVAARDQDPLAVLSSKYRNRRAGKIRRAYETRVSWRVGNAADAPVACELIAQTLKRHGTAPQVLPDRFVDAVIRAALPGLELLVATTHDARVIGINVNFRWRSTYYLWLAGYDRAFLSTHCQSDLLNHAAIQRAVTCGCTEIQAGRSPYAPKRQFGYAPVPLLCAVRGASPRQHASAVRWINALAVRHAEKYPEVCATDEKIYGQPPSKRANPPLVTATERYRG